MMDTIKTLWMIFGPAGMYYLGLAIGGWKERHKAARLKKPSP